MVTMVCIAGVVISAGVLEKRFVAQGDAAAARTVKQFGRWFLIGSGACAIWMWVTASLALIV
ncbi:hypothetical protein [Paenibacillus sp. LHD-38]|uniref:hypothetical protein n=1 Tax=Paenibacillus sp. LHD-38 TaxID=3072143 RepID=UPI002810578D|nr:hypothetical protein [Paenibacillus sp. LHD-38]MDQ8735099.1 hypothetical protein [Paenibacillus sp. LHD-38]